MKFALRCLLGVMILGSWQTAWAQKKNYNRQVRKTEIQLFKKTQKNADTKPLMKHATPDAFWIQEFIATMDPALGRPTPESLLGALQTLNNEQETLYGAMPGTTNTPWVERGPTNVGGRTRALAWDPWDASGKKVWAGGITGGLWFNTDITNANNSWQHVSGLWSNLSVSAIAFDPNNAGTMYVGTGEGFGASTSTSRGYGIWKSVDSGKTFTWLSSTSTYYYVNDLIVRNESGNSVLYAAVDANYFGGDWQGLTSYGLFRSTNGGTSWTNVAGNAPNGQKYAFADLELDANNGLWAGTRNNPYSGVDRGGGRVLYSTNGTSWTSKYSLGKTGRVELACAPGDAEIVYAVFESSLKVDTILVTRNSGLKWSSLAKPDDADLGISPWDFTRGQAWYDLIIAVDPNDTNTLVIGGIDLFRSTTGGSSWSQISKWSNNANLNTLSCSYVHADQHAIAFKKGSSSTCIFGTDGGVFYTSNLASAAASNVIADRNKNYITSQFYWADFGASSGSNLMLGGMQDNGTVQLNAAGLTTGVAVTGGDGAYCFVSSASASKQITSYIYNNYYYTTNNWASSGNLIQDGTTGKFINPAEWDNAQNGLFTCKAQGSLYRIKLGTSPGTLQTITWSATGVPSAIKSAPLSGAKTRLFVGTDAGKLYVTQDAWATTPTFTNITGTINAGNISGVYNLRSGDTIAITLSNYGINNVYISKDGGANWQAAEGNLPNQPVWSVILNPDKLGEAVIATETGVYGTTNIFASSPVWSAYTNGMGAVKIATLRYRSSDKMLLAATHGRGLFTSDAWAKNTPISYFGTSTPKICSNQSLQLKDSSLNNPTAWAWVITPKTFNFIAGTDSTSQNPSIRFNNGGSYTVKLTVTNQLGANALIRNSLIEVTDTIPGLVTLLLDKDTLCNGDSLQLNAIISANLSGTITAYQWKLGAVNATTAALDLKVKPTAGESFKITLTSNKYCVSPSTFTSDLKTPVVQNLEYPTVAITAPSGCAGSPLLVTASGTSLGTAPSFDWYIDGILQSGNASTLNIASPINSSSIQTRITVAGACIRPTNLVESNVLSLQVFPKPAKPSVSRSFDTLTAANQGSGAYTWYRNGQVASNNRVFNALQNGNYRCVYTENGCASDSSNLISITNVSIDGFVVTSAELFPVPATSVLFLKENLRVESIEVYSISGQLVLHYWTNKKEFTDNGVKYDLVEIDVKALNSGSYMLRYKTSIGVQELRFIKD